MDMFTYTDGFDIEVAITSPLGPVLRTVHVEIEWEIDAGNDYDRGDYWTPPSGGDYAEAVDARVLAVELYSDETGEIVERVEFERASVDSFEQVVHLTWCPYKPRELVSLIVATNDLDEYHLDAASKLARTARDDRYEAEHECRRTRTQNDDW